MNEDEQLRRPMSDVVLTHRVTEADVSIRCDCCRSFMEWLCPDCLAPFAIGDVYVRFLIDEETAVSFCVKCATTNLINGDQ